VFMLSFVAFQKETFTLFAMPVCHKDNYKIRLVLRNYDEKEE